MSFGLTFLIFFSEIVRIRSISNATCFCEKRKSNTGYTYTSVKTIKSKGDHGILSCQK